MKLIHPKNLSFEGTIDRIEDEIVQWSMKEDVDVAQKKAQIALLENQKKQELGKLYATLSRWETVQVARHPDRPKTIDFANYLIPDHISFSGDRLFREDSAIYGAIGTFHGSNLMIIGHDRGNTTKEKIKNNFGMANPEGYHKAIRLMHLAEKFHAPILTLIDTQGAYPGIQAEEMGQSAAIANNLRELFSITVPIFCLVIGEGGSGGALGIGIGNRIAMLEYSIYSVISPEGCASILWRDASKASIAAEQLQLTAKDLLAQSLIDSIIEEPLGGAHRSPKMSLNRVDSFVHSLILQYSSLSEEEILAERYNKFITLASLS